MTTASRLSTVLLDRLLDRMFSAPGEVVITLRKNVSGEVEIDAGKPDGGLVSCRRASELLGCSYNTFKKRYLTPTELHPYGKIKLHGGQVRLQDIRQIKGEIKADL